MIFSVVFSYQDHLHPDVVGRDHCTHPKHFLRLVRDEVVLVGVDLFDERNHLSDGKSLVHSIDFVDHSYLNQNKITIKTHESKFFT